MDKIVLEVTHVTSEKHEGVKMDEHTNEAVKRLGFVMQTVTLKPVNRNKATSVDNEVHYEPLRITLSGNELNLGDRFLLELTPVR